MIAPNRAIKCRSHRCHTEPNTSRAVSSRSRTANRATYSTPAMVLAGPLGPSLAPTIRKSRTLYRWIKPVADWYADLAGYRKVGYKYDDLRTCSSGAWWQNL